MARLLDLPSELLVTIFELATDNPTRNIDEFASLPRFEPIYREGAAELCKSAFRTKSSLTLVCKTFRRLTLRLLYEYIWIRHGCTYLLEALELSKKTSRPGSDLGSYVKRVSISIPARGESETHQSWDPIFEAARSILSLCPDVCAISRPHEILPGERQEDGEVELHSPSNPIDDLDFPHLHRVDWYNTHSDLPFASIPSPRFIWNSNSLRVLIVGADNFPSRPDDGQDQEIVISLPNLHTLGIRSFNTFGYEGRPCTLHLPSLRRLIIGRPEAIYNFYSGCLAPFGSQITEIELEPDVRFLRHDFVTTLLCYCPNVRDLCIPIGTTRPVNRTEIPRVVTSFVVERVWLHAAFPGSPKPGTGTGIGIGIGIGTGSGRIVYDYKDVPWWTLLREHFECFCGTSSRFTKLERIMLCGEEWRETVEDERFAELVRLTRVKGVNVECEDKKLQDKITKLVEVTLQENL